MYPRCNPHYGYYRRRRRYHRTRFTPVPFVIIFFLLFVLPAGFKFMGALVPMIILFIVISAAVSLSQRNRQAYSEEAAHEEYIQPPSSRSYEPKNFYQAPPRPSPQRSQLEPDDTHVSDEIPRYCAYCGSKIIMSASQTKGFYCPYCGQRNQ